MELAIGLVALVLLFMVDMALYIWALFKLGPQGEDMQWPMSGFYVVARHYINKWVK